MERVLRSVAAFLAISTLATTSTAALTAPNGYALHESRSHRSGSIQKRGVPVHPDAILPVKIGLKQSNLDLGDDFLANSSHPDSPTYGQHLTSEEVSKLFAPSTETVDAVRDWLAGAAGLKKTAIQVSDNGWLALHLPVHMTERVFHTKYYEVEDNNGRTRIACDAYYLPAHLQQHIDYITPGVKPSPVLTKRSTSLEKSRSVSNHRPIHKPPHWNPHPHQPWHMPPGAQHLPPDLQDCGRNITPTCIRALYGIPIATLNDSVNAMGLFEEGDFYAQKDLDSFFTEYASNVPNGTAPLPAFIDGAQAPVAADDPTNTGESDIDMDMAFSLIYPQNVILYQVDDMPNSNPGPNATAKAGFLNTFLDALDGSYCNYTYDGLTGDSPTLDPVYPDPAPGGYKGQLQCGVYNPARVISISYGEAEADVPERYQKRQCNEIMKLVLQGHTILLASGDYGVASFPGDPEPIGCLSANGQNNTIYNPDFTSSCPYILSVGGTQLYDNQTINDPESVMQDNLGPGAELFSSAGGFSNRYEAPAYQKKALATYFSQHDPGLPYYVANANASNIGAGGGIYNRAGRGFPDVSANGAKFRAYTNNTDFHYYGTSLAAPLFASVLTLINEERTAVGKGPVGFVNPVLYEHPYVLNDIKNGSNPGCGSGGFPAVTGWDPVTGLGTPNYPKMLKLFMSLP